MCNPFALYRDARFEVPGPGPGVANNLSAHLGLSFEKFFGFWTTSGEIKTVKADQYGADPVLDWLDPRPPQQARLSGRIVRRLAGDAVQLTEAGRRLEALVASQNGHSKVFRLESRLISGIGRSHPSENGFVFHPVLGIPYLPASGLKQVAAEALDLIPEEIVGANALDAGALSNVRSRITGAGDTGHSLGAVTFLDALPVRPVELTAEIIASHYGPWYGHFEPQRGRDAAWDEVWEPADWHDPVPVTLLAVELGATFRVAVLPGRGCDDATLSVAWASLEAGLKLLGFGARTTLGFGRLTALSE